jgi:membrane-associated progesterone receptor component
MNSLHPTMTPSSTKEEEEVEAPPRNFTSKQLAYFDGCKDEKSGEDKPVFLSVGGTVFDVSEGRNFYGPDGPYANFAGRECGVALAKMSFDTEHLDDLAGCKTLNVGEKNELEGWIEKFTYYRNYPIKGKLIAEDDLKALESRVLTGEDLSQHTGDEGEVVPEGYAAPSIYIGAGDKVYDASFGGIEFYGKENFVAVHGDHRWYLASCLAKTATSHGQELVRQERWLQYVCWQRHFACTGKNELRAC